ncbi:hypothetical protein SAMN05421856_11036 [Chryseobacterium taichungense]|uniref:Uncharacterized protein n=1 Tax=Chryseobacterium taichungense TaxID=295069 RepID=A0A1H8CPD1_9FLAO|nr:MULTISPECIES: hypothetical protein [Chryseobacterium]MCT4319245.1 hypothetical protein [Elizabethkingia anophelis]MEB4760222.1 hypothetical protein [Chryseobacterium indologenes]UMQ40560.1 hypothetical protein MKS83_14270 [Chryseobacterium sp. Y16C]SEM96759.1 hypothetical protein SAMN05421856_11036 [Chryseobacterium taichungense]
MNDQLDFLKCYYRPAFFKIKIDLPFEFKNLQELTDGALSLYLHEYIHFIQDISTIYGLVNISTINYYIQDCASRIFKENKKEFQVPLKLSPREGDYGYSNFCLQPIYLGSKINPKRTKIELVSYKYGSQVFNDKNEKVNIIKVTLNDAKSNANFEVSLGGILITEGMAYLSERYVYSEILQSQGANVQADEYPYLVVEKIAQKIYPELAQYTILLIAVCDCSLMTYHPGLSFIRAMEFLSKSKFIETNLDNDQIISKLYEVLSAFLKGNHFDLDVIVEQVRDSIKKSFKASIFDGNNQWIDVLFDRITILRREYPQFIIDFLQGGNLKNNKDFAMFYLAFGSPLVVNSEDKGTVALPSQFNPENFQPHLFWAINQILKIFTNQSPTPCELKGFCKKSSELEGIDDITDERCDNAPWEKHIDLCPVGAIWRHWALAGFSPKTAP